MNSIGISDFQQNVENQVEEKPVESPGLQAVRRAAKSPQAKALKEANEANGHLAQARRVNQEWRSGPGREDRNLSERVAYARRIQEDEGRTVRAYQEATPARRSQQIKAAKRKAIAALSPIEQKAKRDRDNAARSERRRAAKQRKLDEAQRQLEAAKGFGEF